MRYNIGEFEEIVLLIVASQNDEAYGLSITNVIEETLKRSVTMSSVHTSLYRLEEKGFVQSTVGGATNERGGRRKRFYSITDSGKKALLEAKSSRSKLWNMIPEVVFNK